MMTIVFHDAPGCCFLPTNHYRHLNYSLSSTSNFAIKGRGRGRNRNPVICSSSKQQPISAPASASSSSSSSSASASSSASSSALVSQERATTEEVNITLTYLEGNSWLWGVDGLNILVDPILVGNLDFGIPFLYDAAKKMLKNFQLDDLPEHLDCLLITQSLDDHCHLKTLKPLSNKFPHLPVFATPNAQPLLDPLFDNVTYLEPSQSSQVEGKNGAMVTITATAGPVLGPPWQRPENGYIITSRQSQLALYYEPHCVYNKSFLQKYRADIIITPVIKQLLPGLTLVSGQEDAVHLAKLLQARYVVPMKNGDLDSRGLLSRLVSTVGTVESFKELLQKELPHADVFEAKPGVPLEISLSSSVP